MNKQPRLIGVEEDYGCDVGGVFRKHTQELSNDFMNRIKEQRNESKSRREGEFMSVAQIPTIVVEQWMREGFDILSDRNITAHDIIKRLKAEHLDGFLTTTKTVN